MSVEVKAQNTISMTSVKAIKDATDEANTLLDSMRQSAEDAGTTLNGIYQDAEDAKTNAGIAQQSAETAMANLSQIQSVLEVVEWVALHGEYEKTTDVAINPNKTYYTVTATAVATPTDDDIGTYYELVSGEYVKTTDTAIVVGKTYYTVVGTPVSSPDVADIGTYYELSINEAMANYIQAHLALTNDGLYVMADNSKWRVLVASDGVYIIDPNGKKVNQMVNSGNILGREGWIQAYLQSVSFRINEPNAGDMFNIHLDTANTDVVDITKNQYASEAVTATSNANGRVDLIATNTPITEQSGTITLTIPTFEFKITDIVIGGVSKEITSVEALQGGTGCTVSVLDDTVTVTPTTASISADTPIATAVSLNTTGYVRVNYTGGQAMLIVGTYSKLEQKTVGVMSVAVATNHILFAPNSTGVSVDIDCTGRSSVTYPYPINPPSMKFGVNNNINHGAYYGVALGKQLSVNHPNQTVIGKNNDNQNDTAFEIGNGTADDARSNAFTVDWSGKIGCGDYSGNFKSIFDLFYPVGSYYETSDTTFNPNTTWGGTWVLETEGLVHISAGANYAVNGATTDTKDGGSTDVPYHNHSVNSASAGSHTHGSKSITGTLRPLFWTTQQGKTEGIVTVGSGNKDRTAGSGTNFGTAAATINATHEHTSVTVTMPAHNTNYAGTSGNNNLPPYIIVNRWHRTA